MLAALYADAPLALWMVVGALFLALDLALGAGFLTWVGLSALVMGGLSLTGWRFGLFGDLVLFCLFSTLAVGAARGQLTLPAAIVTLIRRAERFRASQGGEDEAAPADAALRGSDEALRPERAVSSHRGRIIGRIARTTCPFVDGVGRVWIDGLEWTAEIDSGEALGPDAPVRVMAVVDEDRLQVAGLPG